MNKKWVAISSFSLAFAIVLGALGAHALKEKLPLDQLNSFEVGVRYQMYQSLAILALAISYENVQLYLGKWVLPLLFVGMIFFSFSIYFLSTRSIHDIESLNRIFGPMTPTGGVLMISGWIIFGVRVLKVKS